MVNFAHYKVELKYLKFEWIYDVPYMLLPYTAMQFGRVFPEEKKLNNNENESLNEFNDGVSSFRLEMSTIYLGFNM